MSQLMSRPTRIAAVATGVLAVVVGLAAVYGVLAMQHVEPFYAEALTLPKDAAAIASRELEDHVTDLYRQTPRDRWDATFTEEQVNGWLAVTLAEKFPTLLPPQVRDPRIGLADDRFMVGFQYQGRHLTSVVSIEADASLPEPGVVAMRLRSARAGLLPVASSTVIEEVSAIAAQLKWPIRWEEQEGAPVLVVPMIELFSTETERRRLEDVELREGELTLAGSSAPLDAKSAAIPVSPTARQ
jgi:hypothetical protein